ncbi:MAG: hypothetical protein IPN33_09395 [Saprospiraceae bacterium]|nr:hypothetical protein [Saprospiraceae bacterium]
MNIPAGTYTVTVSAGGSCTNSASFTVANNTATPNLTATPTASTCGLNNGAVDLSISPAGAYTFIWSNGATAEDLSGVAAGAYSVTVTATASSCTATIAATVTNNNPAINISGNASPVTSCTTPNGSINITATPLNTYTYTWSNGAPTEDLVNIPAGTYTVTVSEGVSCTNSASFTVVNNTATPNLTATPTASTCGLNNGAVDLSISPAGAYIHLVEWRHSRRPVRRCSRRLLGHGYRYCEQLHGNSRRHRYEQQPRHQYLGKRRPGYILHYSQRKHQHYGNTFKYLHIYLVERGANRRPREYSCGHVYRHRVGGGELHQFGQFYSCQ